MTDSYTPDSIEQALDLLEQARQVLIDTPDSESVRCQIRSVARRLLELQDRDTPQLNTENDSFGLTDLSISNSDPTDQDSGDMNFLG